MEQRRLLVIDDQPEMCDLVKKVAEPLGYSVTVVQDPGKAVTVYKELKPHVVVLDIIMPLKDGIEVTLDLAKIISTPIPLLILLSGSEENYLSAAAEIARGYGWANVVPLRKPFTVKQMRGLLMNEPENYFTSQQAS